MEIYFSVLRFPEYLADKNMTKHHSKSFDELLAPSANAVFYRTYSRGKKESWQDVCDRTVKALTEKGKLTHSESELLRVQQENLHALPSGRFLWVGGTDWIKHPENIYGQYNCSSTNLDNLNAFGVVMELAMQGCGTGIDLEKKYIYQLPPIRNRVIVDIVDSIGDVLPEHRLENTSFEFNNDGSATLIVGDSRKGWADSYLYILKVATSIYQFQDAWGSIVLVHVYLGNVRKKGEKLKGFGGVANPDKLSELYEKITAITNAAQGRNLDATECCLIIDEAAKVVVAGNIRRSAGMRQAESSNEKFAKAKDNLWKQSEDGKWSIDPDRDAFRMANHTLVYHQKPTLEQVTASVRKQYYSGEGAIQWAGEAVARGNADLIPDQNTKKEFLQIYSEDREAAKLYLQSLSSEKISDDELEHRIGRYKLNPCGEIIGENYFCNLSEVHCNTLDPLDLKAQQKAFMAGGLSAAILLHDKFPHQVYQHSRDLDPIVGVSFTGGFDFFVNLFGVSWLNWWQAGRPTEDSEVYIDGGNETVDYISLSTMETYASTFPEPVSRIVIDWWNGWGIWKDRDDECTDGNLFRAIEEWYLKFWRDTAHHAVWQYCEKHNLKCPNRCTTVQPAGTKSLLTGASPGWHPPKAAYFIRRITFAKNDPVALACMDYGYRVIPSPSDKDSEGNLIDNPFDNRVSEWLVEIPTITNWAHLFGVEQIDISKFSVAAQFDFYMQVQRHYTTHNTSATLEIRESEIEEYSRLLYESIQDDNGYISVALLARFDDRQTFPRLPFEPISYDEYQKLLIDVAKRRRHNIKYSLSMQANGQEPSFGELVEYFQEHMANDETENAEVGPSGCDSDKCLLPEAHLPSGETNG